MSNLISLALLAGLAVGFVLSFKKSRFPKIGNVTIVLSVMYLIVLAISTIFYDYQLLDFSKPLDQSFVFWTVMLGIAPLITLNLKAIDLYISELQYVLYTVMTGFILFSIFNPSFMVTIAWFAGMLLLLLPIIFLHRLPTLAKFTYYILFSGMNTLLFFVLIGFTGLQETLLSFPVSVWGLLATFLFGWSLYLYVAHAIILMQLLPSKHGWGIKDLYQDIPGHFGDVQYRPMVLMLASVVCLVSLVIIEYFTKSFIVTISFTMTAIAFLSKLNRSKINENI